MDRQARKLQIQREQQGYYEGSATSILHPDTNESTDGNSASIMGRSGSGGTASTIGMMDPIGNRINDVTLLSDDDEKEVSSKHQ